MKESQAREAFAASVRAHALAMDELALIRTRQMELAAVIAEQRTRPFRAADQIASLAAQRDLVAQETTCMTAVHKAANEMEARRQLWLTARRDVRLLDNLKAKARAEHTLASQREEQALLDDRTNALASRAG